MHHNSTYARIKRTQLKIDNYKQQQKQNNNDKKTFKL